MTSDWGLATMGPKMLVRPIRAQKARPRIAYECPWVLQWKWSSGFASGTFPLCYCVPSVFCRKRPSGDFAKPSWTVLSKRLLRTGVVVQVLETGFETLCCPGFETFLPRPNRALVLTLFSVKSWTPDSSCFGSRLSHILVTWPELCVGGCDYSRLKRKVLTFLKL